jgi:hypothetical protein
VFAEDPFHTLDTDGVGELLHDRRRARAAVRPDLTLSICGEHGGNPESIAFCRAAGFDYVSCSPFRVPVARLAGGATCQFTYTCDGQRGGDPEPSAFARVAKVARAMLDGKIPALTDGATHYHTTAVQPRWSRKYTSHRPDRRPRLLSPHLPDRLELTGVAAGPRRKRGFGPASGVRLLRFAADCVI